MSGYRDLASFYDALTEDVPYEEWASYWMSLFRHHGCEPGSLLDLACGSGSLTRLLARKGLDMVGVDGSAEMLTEARQKGDGEENILYLCQDMRQLDLYGTVDGAICMLDSLNHLPDTAAVAEVFRRLGLFIAPGGLFLFDVNTPHKHRETLGNNAFVLETDGLLCAWRNAFRPAKCETLMHLDFFVRQEDGTYDRWEDEVRERAYTLNTWQKLLEEAGFDLLGVYGERSFAPPSPEADRWVLAAKNRAIAQRNG